MRLTGKKALTWGIAATVVCVLLAGVAYGVLVSYRNYRQQAYLKTADAYFEQGQWRDAKKYYEYYLTKHPGDVEVLKKYAETGLRRLESRDDALRLAAQAFILIAQHETNNVDVENKVLEIEEKAGAYSDLEYYAELFLRNRPDDPRLLNLRAVALDRGGRRDEAIDAYRALIDKNIAEPKVYPNLAILLTERKLNDQAQGVLAKALEQHPQDGPVRAQRARYYLYAHDFDAASQEIDEALRLAPDAPEVLLGAVLVALAKRDWTTAQQYGEKLIAAHPEVADAYVPLARAYAQEGQIEKAITLLSNLDPFIKADNTEIVMALFDLLLNAGHREEAQQVVDFFAKAHPANGVMQDYLKARMALADGRSQEAVSLLESVVVRMPALGPAHSHLAVAYMQAGEPDKARQSLESYLRTSPDDTVAQTLLQRIMNPPKGIEELLAAAKQLQGSEGTTADVLTGAAMQVYDAARRKGRETEFVKDIHELLDKATERDPKAAAPYQALCDIYSQTKDFTSANQVLQKASEAGVEEKALSMPRAALALLQGDPNAARTLCDKDVARPDITSDEVIRWAGLFASKEQVDAALDILSKAAERMQGEAKQAVTIEHVLMTARLRDPAQALVRVESLESAGMGGLNDTKLTIAREILRRDGPDAIAKAKAIVEAVRRSDPASLQAQILDAQIRLQDTPPDYAAARKDFMAVMTTDPTNESALLGLARVAMLQRDFQGAFDWAQKALNAAPNSLRAALQQAEALMRLERFEDAEKTLQGVVAADPNNPAALEMLTSTLIETGKKDEAKTFYEKLKGLLPTLTAQRAAALQQIEARLMLAHGSTAEAEAALRKRLAEDPSSLDVTRDLAMTLAQMNRGDEAEKMLRDYAEAHKDGPEAWVALAQFYTRGGTPDQLSKASSALTRALLASPDDPQALREMVDLQMRRGDAVSALLLCDRYLQRHPDDPVMLFRKASLLGQQNEDLPQALTLIQRAIDLDNKSDYIVLRGLLQVALRNYPQGIQDLQAIAQGGQTSALVDAALAEAYAATGDKAKAGQFLESATHKSGNGDTVSAARLDKVRRMLGP